MLATAASSNTPFYRAFIPWYPPLIFDSLAIKAFYT